MKSRKHKSAAVGQIHSLIVSLPSNINIDAQQAHAILGSFAVPIGGSILGILAGVLAGGAGEGL